MTSNSNLIIGVNSNIIKSIKNELIGFDFASHEDLFKDEIKFHSYNNIFLFSWSHKSLDDNKKIIKILPSNKIVFISTTAVLSILLRKQWNNYPNWKNAIEKLVLKNRGRVIRIGVWDGNVVKNSIGNMPYTSKEDLINLLNNFSSYNDKVLTPIRIVEGKGTTPRHKILNIFHNFSFLLPPTKIFQAPLQLFIKILNSSSYGYSKDSASLFSDNAIVGFGALGSNVYKRIRKKNLLVICSNEEDIVLNSNGFNGTKIGKNKIGLSRYWHGVFITTISEKFGIKNVPIFVKRPKPPKNTLLASVNKISEEKQRVKICFKSNTVSEPYVYARNLHLCAGAIQNTSLLLKMFGIESANLSDHEIGMIGKASTKEVIEKGLLNKFLFIIYGRKILFEQNESFNYMLDFRPENKSKHISEEDKAKFFDDSTKNIFYKLFNRFSLHQINEAFFNKFGFGFKTKNVSVFLQVLAKDSIKVCIDGSLQRKRLDIGYIEEIYKRINLLTFQKTNNPLLIDAQHIYGGKNLENKIFLNNIYIYGSPTLDSLDAFHHTQSLIDRINKYE